MPYRKDHSGFRENQKYIPQPSVEREFSNQNDLSLRVHRSSLWSGDLDSVDSFDQSNTPQSPWSDNLGNNTVQYIHDTFIQIGRKLVNKYRIANTIADVR